MAKKACSTSYLKVYLTVSQDRFKGNILLVIFYHRIGVTSNPNRNFLQENLPDFTPLLPTPAAAILAISAALV
ncbi:hypothetical protein [Phascolarctobacterium sp.]|uniref:hypothetical protein n=1 Tax=Phascolarctobacterium sp. TaxID=2049039 RepID=UPI0027D98C43|nr:hypothetical protein [uncultured Phascolarctobacterium sp.]